MSYTNSDLVTSIKKRASLPSSQDTWTAASILELASEFLQTEIMGTLISIREEYFVTSSDTTIVSGQTRYPIDSRAVGMTLRDLLFVSGDNVSSIDSISADSREHYGSNVLAYYLEWNDIILTSTAVGSLRQVFQIRPNELVEVANCAKITAIDTATFTVTVDAVPSAFIADTVTDMIRADGGREHRAINQTIASVSSLDLVYTELPSGLAVGDWIALKGESPTPQLPDAYMGWLAQKAVVQILESLGDDKWQAAKNRLDKIEESILQIATPRNRGESKVVVARMPRTRTFY